MEFPINHGKNSMEYDGVLQSSGVNISHDK